jgi:putative transposase
MYELDRGTNGVYSLHYHFITCVKYRRKVFVRDDIVEDLKQITEQVASEYDVQIVEQECGEDHIHILFRCKPTLIFKDFIQAVKGRSARLLRSKYSDYLQGMLWGKHFWSPSYFLATTGNVTIDILKQYIENQRNEMEV